jgi:SAM-dependent methyltransferase
LKNPLKERNEKKTKILEELKNSKNLKLDIKTVLKFKKYKSYTTIKFMKNQYDGWELPFFDKAKNFRNYQHLLTKKYIKGDVAEIGPGNGSNLKLYKKQAKKIFLFEPTKKNFLKLKKKFNKNNIFIKNNYFFKNKKKFDTILYFDVLEHIQNDLTELSFAYNILRNNGYLIINVPAFPHLFSEFDRDVNHLRRYTKKDMIYLIKKFKIKYIKMKYYDSIGYIFSLISKFFIKDYKKKFKDKIKFWDFLIPLSKFIDKISFNSFGKSLLIIIKK